MPSRHRRGTLASGRAVMNSPKDRAKVDATPVGLRTPQPAPETASLTVPDAARGNVGPRPAPARAVPAAAQADGVRGNPSRNADREGNAGPAVGTVGPAQSSPSEPAPLGSGGASGTESPPPAPSRIAPVVRPPGGRGPQSSPPVAEGRAGGDEGGGPALRRRTPGAGPSPVPSPAGGRLSTSPPAVRGLRGRDALKAWQAAKSGQAKDARNNRGRYPAKPAGGRYVAGMARRMPPPPDGDAA
jgi:hypothetical protein